MLVARGTSPEKWVWQSSGWYDEPGLRCLTIAIDDVVNQRGRLTDPIATFLVAPCYGVANSCSDSSVSSTSFVPPKAIKSSSRRTRHNGLATLSGEFRTM